MEKLTCPLCGATLKPETDPKDPARVNGYCTCRGSKVAVVNTWKVQPKKDEKKEGEK